MEFMLAPLIVFLVFVAPLWLIMHYRLKSKVTQGLSENELKDFEGMLETLDYLVERVEILEDILDEEHPDWRKNRDSQQRRRNRRSEDLKDDGRSAS